MYNGGSPAFTQKLDMGNSASNGQYLCVNIAFLLDNTNSSGTNIYTFQYTNENSQVSTMTDFAVVITKIKY
jgi:hypothetical protein